MQSKVDEVSIKCESVSETQGVLRNAIRKKLFNHPPPCFQISLIRDNYFQGVHMYFVI